MKKINLINKKFNKLTVISENGKAGKETLWKCKCDCGNFINVRGYNLKNGHTKSCGCIRQQNSKNTIKKKNKQYIERNVAEEKYFKPILDKYKNKH